MGITVFTPASALMVFACLFGADFAPYSRTEYSELGAMVAWVDHVLCSSSCHLNSVVFRPGSKIAAAYAVAALAGGLFYLRFGGRRCSNKQGWP
jgi:hypothetical protein